MTARPVTMEIEDPDGRRFASEYATRAAWRWPRVLCAAAALAWCSPPAAAQPSPPQPGNDEVYYQIGKATVADLLANDGHPDGLPLRVEESTVRLVNGSPGRLDVVWNGIVRYTPPAGFAGVAEATYAVSDIAGGRVSGVTIRFLPTTLTVYPEPTASGDAISRLTAAATGPTSIALELTYDGAQAVEHEVLVGQPEPLAPFSPSWTVPPQTPPELHSLEATGLTPATGYCFAVETLVAGETVLSETACATTEAPPTVTHPVTFLTFPEGVQNKTIGIDRLQGLGGSTGRVYAGLVDSQTSAGGTIVENGEGAGLLLLYSAPWGETEDSFEYFWQEPDSGLTGRGLVEITLTPAGAAVAKFRVTCGVDGIPRRCLFDFSESRLASGQAPGLWQVGFVFGDGRCQWSNRPGCTNPPVSSSHTHVHEYAQEGVYNVQMTVLDHASGQMPTTQRLAFAGESPQLLPSYEVACVRQGPPGTGPFTCTFDARSTQHSALGPDDYVDHHWTLRLPPPHSPLQGSGPVWTVPDLEPCRLPDLCPVVRLTSQIVYDGGNGGTFPASPILTTGVIEIFDAPPVALPEIRCDDALPVCVFDAGASRDDNEIASYKWRAVSPAGWLPAPRFEESFVHRFPAYGTYRVRLTVTDDAGQTDQEEVSFAVPAQPDQPPFAQFAMNCQPDVNSQIVCELDAGGSSDDRSGEGELLYSWELVPIHDGPQPRSLPRCPPSFHPICLLPLVQDVAGWQIGLTVMDEAGHHDGKTFDTLKGSPLAAFDLHCDSASGYPASCFADASRSIDDQGIASFEWRIDGATAATGTYATLLLPEGQTIVQLVATDGEGNKGRAKRRVCLGCLGDPPPVAAMAPVLCRGNRCLLDAGLSGDAESLERVLWEVTSTDGSTVTAAGDQAEVELADGTWTVTLTVVDDSAQSSRQSRQIVVGTAADHRTGETP